MRVYGIADSLVDEIVDFFSTREEAERTLEQILADEPSWQGSLEVVSVELPPSPN